jgi:hypothetical protein
MERRYWDASKLNGSLLYWRRLRLPHAWPERRGKSLGSHVFGGRLGEYEACSERHEDSARRVNGIPIHFIYLYYHTESSSPWAAVWVSSQTTVSPP